ncbi:TetR family transcriptional regulator [Paenibacillus sp. J2TS4]|uniref:TetR family transcriptional regulator n=1 Tax=Paenibacillus sp. J2TS4 TaxID=2807194 RepID=UPI001B206D8A|nr:TetR family transcriptional regulator [Paenibacillus sp. J2TS4]GIP34880.1 TetR family transcriptional regulator [Paenibacillus sp. J2TS4]
MAPKVSDEYKAQKKKELLQAAERVFVHKGYTQATMQDVMEAAGVSRGALYSYFDNIEHVFIEVLQREDQQVLLFFAPEEEAPLWGQLTGWVYRQRESIENIRRSLVRAKSEFFLTTGDMQNSPSHSYITERYQSLVDAIKRFIEKGIEQGEFRPRAASEAIALYLISFLDGLMLDTFQLGAERTKVNEQLEVLLLSLQGMLDPVNH